MGVLTIGTPLTWENIKPLTAKMKYKYTQSFLMKYLTYVNNRGVGDKFGEELEYSVFCCYQNYHTKELQIKLGKDMSSLIYHLNNYNQDATTSWHPEYGDWMVEGVSEKPFDGLLDGILNLETRLKQRRRTLLTNLKIQEICPTLSLVPNLCHQITNQSVAREINATTESQLVSDTIIYPHVRFHSLTENIRKRRGKRVNIPINVEPDDQTRTRQLSGDAMAFGMGCCCLQVTLEAKSLDESLLLFDILQPLSTIMLAISAATPFAMGYLKTDNTRWDMVSHSVKDDADSPVSRFDMCPCYLHPYHNSYHDVAVELDAPSYQQLTERGISRSISRYVSQILHFDPVLVFHNDDYNFKSHQSTVWQNVRWKPPGEEGESWRVEFRTMEIQLTDFENTALILFTVLYARSCLALSTDNCLPISKNNSNMRAAVRCRDLSKSQFWWNGTDRRCRFLTLVEIISQILAKIKQYLDLEYPEIPYSQVEPYLNLIADRVNGNKLTCAEWLREYVVSHPQYRGDSVVNKRVIYDLVNRCHEIGMANHY